MKKLLFILFSLYSLFSFGQPDPSFTSNIARFSATSDVAKGETTINYTKFYGDCSGCCNDQLTSESVDYRIGNGPWISIYTAPSSSLGSGINGSIQPYPAGGHLYMRLIITNLPGSFYSQSSEIRLKGDWDEINVSASACGGEPTEDVDITRTLNNSIDPVDNLTATDGSDCDEVKVYFTRPAAYNSLPSGTSISYKIERSLRSGTSKDLLDGNDGTINYFDPTAAPGVLYKYYITPILTYANGRKAYGDVGITNGSRFGIPGNASGLFLDQVNCSGNIKVEWNWSNSTNPDNFIVERSNTNSFSSGVTTIPVSGSDRSTRDAGTSIGSTYFYRVSAQDNCPNNTTKKAKSTPTATEEVIGLGIPPIPVVTSITKDITGKSITVNWIDNTNMEDGFKVVRQSGTGQVEFDVAADQTSYTDNSAETCTNYTYLVKTYNSCKQSGVLSTTSFSDYIPVDIKTTFNATHKIEATDGEFGERIDLKWGTLNRQNDDWNIIRINPLTLDTVPLPSVDGKTKSYSDLTANANTLYKYIIQGVVDCANNIDSSNKSEDIGFRLAFGTINGQVTYSGASGTAVEGVKVIAQAASGASGFSGGFNGTSSVAKVKHSTSLETDSMTVLALIKPIALSGNQTIASKQNGTTGWRLYLDGANLKFDVGSNTYSATNTSLVAGNWISVGASLSNDTAKLFVNGDTIFCTASSQTALNTIDSLKIGSDGLNYFAGVIDEVRLYNRPLTLKEVQRSYDVYINPSMSGLVGYWRFDEGFGNTAYDYSKNFLSSNKNHALLHSIAYNVDKPSASQLSPGAYTDVNGSYFIPFVPYLGNGDNFIISPLLGIHDFLPKTTTLYIGGSSPNYSNINFSDESNFTVKGSVKFKNTSCFVKDVYVLVDGQRQLKADKSFVKTETDASGNTGFEVSVPIGQHTVSVELQGHEFEVGSYSTDFQDSVDLGPYFIDSTLITVIGRVAGGGIQKSMPPGLRGKNNIGVANINFMSQQGSGCLDTTITTSVNEGLYQIKLPPMRYTIPEFMVNSNSGIKFANKTLDLTIIRPIITHYDTIFETIAGVKRIKQNDSTKYHIPNDYNFTKSPIIDVWDKNLGSNYGAATVEYSDKVSKFDVPTAILGFPFPIFEENDKYTWQITAFEVYENKDGGGSVLDSVPFSDGKLKITNNLASNVSVEFVISPNDNFSGIQEYTFSAGQANTAPDVNPRLSYTKTFELDLIPVTGSVVSYKINDMGTPSLFRGIVFGGKSLGNSFATAGPKVVTMILRDPPGSNSYSTWEKNTTFTTKSTFENAGGIGGKFDQVIKAGTEFTIGLGYSTKTKVENNLNSITTSRTEINDKEEFIETTTNSINLSTGNSRESVGPSADLFYGKSFNMDFGLAEVITLIDVAQCTGGSATCTGDTYTYNNRSFKLGSTKTMTVVPGGYGTEFYYTQKGIEETIIPRLEGLKLQQLTTNSNYTLVALPTDPNYGKSNDDEAFSGNPLQSPDALRSSIVDSTGPSYVFSGYKTKDTVITTSILGLPIASKSLRITTGLDSVWWYNRQIKIWQEAIEINEREKVLADLLYPLYSNKSFIGGPSVTFTESTTRDTTDATVVHFNLSEEVAIKLGAELGGVGFELTQGINLDYNRITDNSTTNTTQNIFSYTIDEPDIANNFTVDIFNPKDGYGPIFKTRGGESSCPYEDADVTKYYRPGAVINAKTIQLEEPQLTAIGSSSLYNVPADAVATFNIKLANLGQEDVVFDLRVLESSNPNGAEIRIDGINPNRAFVVPKLAPVNKQVTIRKGATHIGYDSLALVLHSQCQYDIGTIGSENIADTLYLSVYFLPSCTEVEVSSPDDLFVINTNFNNIIPIEISNYDINYGGLEKLRLEYRPSSQSQWIPTVEEWFKDSSSFKGLVPPHPAPIIIPTNQAYINYDFLVDQLPDQNYQFRAVSTCKIPGNPDKDEPSGVIGGIVDRVYPQPFGTPSPGDGVLDPNDDISIKFNETINSGKLNPDNFQITGVLNGSPLSYAKTISFDGIADYLEIANGFDFASEDFTIEFWAKRNGIGSAQSILSQGTASNNKFSLGFNATNQLEITLKDQTYSSTFSVTDVSSWHHYTITFNKNTTTVEFTNRFGVTTETSTNNNFFANYQSGGKTYFGKSAVSITDYFDGSLFEFRIWNKALTPLVVNSRKGESLTGREPGLIGYWPMDDGRGSIARDVARFRHAQVFANWELNPKSLSASFDGIDDYAILDAAQTLSITPEMDMTIEFWFKTSGGSTMSFLSNGTGLEDINDINRNGWNIELAANNTIHVKNDGQDFEAVSTDFADNNWHHFALVVNRIANTTAFIDGVQQNTVSSDSLYGFGSEKLAIGSRILQNGTVFTYDQPFQGNIDEVRIWNSARLQSNIELEQYHRLKGDEFGLLAYYPFEKFINLQAVPVSTFEDKTANGLDLTASGTIITTESATIALERQVENVSYSWVVNNDKIVFNLNEAPARIENVTLNVAVKNVEDLHGNAMQSPKTWIAFINKNQVLWQDAKKNLTKELNDTLTFTATIINSGGDIKNFNISSLPAWLTANQTSGSINPLTSETIKFTVNQAVNIGNYSEDILLSTNFGFDEKLLINLKVSKTAPAFAFDPNLYQNSMSIIGQIRINGSISYQADDKIVALINGQVRGVANLQYISAYDSYMAFLDVYSNTTDSIDFQVWNSSKGELHIDVQPRLKFESNGLVGSPSSPQFFDAKNNISKPVILQPGWNWVSFPLNSDLFSNIPSFMSLNRTEGDLIKTRGDSGTTQYGTQTGWLGDLNAKGIQAEKSYMVYVSSTDTIDHRGLALDPDTMPITVNATWNRIGFISLKNLSINTALANYNAVNGDIIKSQQQFAYYDQNLGWIGSLQTMEPTEGYLLHASAASSFVYPRLGLLRTKSTKKPERLEDVLPVQFSLNPKNFEESTVAIAELNGCDEIVSSEDFALAAFYKNEVRGWSSKAEKLENDLGFRYFITAYGSSAEEFSFKIVNKNDGSLIELNERMLFNSKTIQGTPENSIQLTSIEPINCDQFKSIETPQNVVVFPNPFTSQLTITIPSIMSEQTQIALIDEHGRILYQENTNGRTVVKWNRNNIGNLAVGVYHIRFIDNEEVVVEKVIKL